MPADELDCAMDDGAVVHVYRWRPTGTPRAVVQVVHGMAEHAGRYARLATGLVDQGYEVWAHDHRGHGRTATVDDDLGHLADHDGLIRLVDDVLRVRRAIDGGEHGEAGRRVALYAHSMGSFVAQAALVLRPPSPWDAVILSGSDAPGGVRISAFRQVARLERLRQGPRGRSAALDALSSGAFNATFKPNRTDADWLSRDTDEVDAFVADRRTGFRLTNQSWVDFLGTRRDVGRRGFSAVSPKDLPILLVAGERDPVGRQGAGVRQLERELRSAGLTEVEVRLYPEARHEMHNELNRDEVRSDVLAFLARALDPE